MLAAWRDVCDERMAVEIGVAVLATERADVLLLEPLDELVVALDGMLEDFTAYRQADVRWHVGLAEATRSPRLVIAMTEVQGAMSELISMIAHPPEVLDVSNAQHRRILAAVRRHDATAAAREMTEHLHGDRARARRVAAEGVTFTPSRVAAEGVTFAPRRPGLTSVQARAYVGADVRSGQQTFTGGGRT